VASVISQLHRFGCEMRNDTGHNGIFRISLLLLKLAPFLAH
jgi:hypothetical protein